MKKNLNEIIFNCEVSGEKRKFNFLTKQWYKWRNNAWMVDFF